MYLTAQRVRSSRGAVGVNAAYYTHAEGEISQEAWAQRPERALQEIAERHPGTRVRDHIEIGPGGNAVECFLDLASPHDVSEEAIVAVLDELGSQLHRPRPAIARGAVLATFSTLIRDDDPSTSFRQLCAAALALFRRGDAPAPAHEDPLRIHVTHDDEQWRYVLEPASAARVQANGGTPAPVTMRFDVADDLRRIAGSLYPHVAQWATSLSAEALLGMGGVEFVSDSARVAAWLVRAR